MSASQAPALDAIAFQLVAALEKYDQDVTAMVASWLDLDRYHAVSDQLEQIRLFSGALPGLGVLWMELLIAHAELVHSLWRLRFQEVDADRVILDEVRERHARCVESLRLRCLRLLARSSEAG